MVHQRLGIPTHSRSSAQDAIQSARAPPRCAGVGSLEKCFAARTRISTGPISWKRMASEMKVDTDYLTIRFDLRPAVPWERDMSNLDNMVPYSPVHRADKQPCGMASR